MNRADITMARWPTGRPGLLRPLLAGIEQGATSVQLVEIEAFLPGMIEMFDAAVAKGQPDTVEEFTRMASDEVARRESFVRRWRLAASKGQAILVPLAELRREPDTWLPRLVRAVTGGDDAQLVDRLGQRLAEHPAPDPTQFRHHDTELLALIARLRLPRSLVVEEAANVLAQAPQERVILRLQAQANLQSLRRSLADLAAKRSARAAAERASLKPFPPYAEVSAEVLVSPEFHAWEKARKTRLGWPRSQLFVSHSARVIYCPIGKVACTFLKRQMARISGIAHAETVIRGIHVLTDQVVTGMQLSDYAEAEALRLLQAPDYLKFAVIREPAERLLSGYMEKFVFNRLNEGNMFHTRSALAGAQGVDEPDFEHGITFRQFVTEVVRTPPMKLDGHWRPQVLYLAGIAWDRIYSMPDMDQVVDMLEERSGMTLPREAANVSGGGSLDYPGAADLLPARIVVMPKIGKASFLEPGLRAAIEAYYAEDYALYRKSLAGPKP